MLGCGNSTLSQDVCLTMQSLFIYAAHAYVDEVSDVRGRLQENCEHRRMFRFHYPFCEAIAHCVLREARSIPACSLRRCDISTRKPRPRWNVCGTFRASSTIAITFLTYVRIGHEMDIRELKFDTDSFDVAIDKGMFRACCGRFTTYSWTYDRNDGRHDDSQGRCLGKPLTRVLLSSLKRIANTHLPGSPRGSRPKLQPRGRRGVEVRPLALISSCVYLTSPHSPTPGYSDPGVSSSTSPSASHTSAGGTSTARTRHSRFASWAKPSITTST